MLAVFSPVRLTALQGARPALGHCTVEWVQTPNAAGEVSHEWVASASAQRIITGRSGARSTAFTVKPPDGHPAPTATSILILHDTEHAGDALCVEAAVRAAADSAGSPINLQNRDITPDAENAAVTDWTFWLSTRPVPGGLAGCAPRIVRYAGGDPVTGMGWIVASSVDAVDGARLWKRVAPPPPGPAGTILWSDGQGEPVLTYARSEGRERWDVYIRFDPAWTDLPRTTALPAWMRALVFPVTTGAEHDRRLADPAQGQISEARATAIPLLAPANQSSRDLHWLFWILAALLFAAERGLSLGRRASRSPVPFLKPYPVAASR